ncbi:hypothetical protein Hbl1158_11290 [Halobaculum sp. CBA1158]|uniref:hypothetical protein n=1 Tax=Halobaculum sp. CBA1158 TaxID=2904243 RepID=UPI001F3DA352|nr:hypothetical protein [Halobaculum sp. CBA1158]UIO99114.1 hypothetical protein Hbl1158_11290 [Halobaculum sp. CBA1158]
MPIGREGSVAERVEEYWGWATAALFLLVTVDLLTTMYAAAAVGSAAEANPLIRWALGRPLSVLVAVNLGAVVLAALVFRGLMETYRLTPARVRPYYALVIEAWLGALVAVGLAVFANNLSVIVLGESLV